MIYLIVLISSIVSGIGIGGGTIFIILCDIFNIYELREAMVVNLIIFITIGITVIVANFKNKIIDKKIFLNLFFFIIIGCILGNYLGINVNNQNLKVYFNVFLLIIGIYEIISSLIKMKKENNNNERSD